MKLQEAKNVPSCSKMFQVVPSVPSVPRQKQTLQKKNSTFFKWLNW